MTGSSGEAAGRYPRGCRRLAEAAITSQDPAEFPGRIFRAKPGQADKASADRTWPKTTETEMTKADLTPGAPSARAAARQARTERLAAALKANLRRRKAQARERATDAGQREHGDRAGQESGQESDQES